MAYIGRGIDKLSNIEKLDVITFDGSSSYSLTKGSVAFTPSSANSLQVSIDGVVQAGNFTVSGSTIDFGTAVASTSTNDFIFHYGTGLITTPADGTVGLNQLSATGTKDATTFLRGDNTFASAGGDNTPIFNVHLNADQTLNDNTATKIQFNTEDIDTDNAFDNSSNYRFTVPSGEGGKYLLQSCIRDFDDQAKLQERRIMLYKNGSEFARQWFYPEHDHGGTATAYMEYGVSLSLNIIVDASASDYYEIYYYGNTRDSGTFLVQGDGTVRESWFQGHKLIT